MNPALSRPAVLLASTTFALMLSIGARAQTADPARVNDFIVKATAVAGADMKAPLQLCKSATAAHEPTEAELHAGLATQMANSYVPPAKVFDNLYFLGTRFVSAWALVTPKGIILLDALDNDQEARDSIEEGMKKVGLDPPPHQIHRRHPCPR